MIPETAADQSTPDRRGRGAVNFDGVRLNRDQRRLADARMLRAEAVAGLIVRAWRAIAR